MLMVILGAGASYDSVPEDDWKGIFTAEYRPPLARELFDAVRRPNAMGAVARRLEDDVQGAGLGGMAARLAALVRGDADGLEAELGKLQERAGSDPITARQMVAVRFYLRDVIIACAGNWISSASRQTNYAALLNLVDQYRRDRRNETVLWVSFNYDVMLEDAASQVLAWKLDAVDQYVNNPDHVLVKPHGSTTWSRVATLPGRRTESGLEVIPRAGEIETLSDVVESHSVSRDDLSVPALAVPTANKTTFECPESHLDKLKELLPEVDRMITIGWRGREQHFLDLCRKASGNRSVVVTVVDANRTAAEDIAAHLRANLGSVGMLPSHAEGFSGFLASPGAVEAAWEGEEASGPPVDG